MEIGILIILVIVATILSTIFIYLGVLLNNKWFYKLPLSLNILVIIIFHCSYFLILQIIVINLIEKIQI